MKSAVRAVAGICFLVFPHYSAFAANPTPTRTPTPTPYPTYTSTPTPSRTPTPTPTPSATPSATPVSTPAPATPTPSPTTCETDECVADDAAAAVENMGSSPEYSIFGAALDALLASLEPVITVDCSVLQALESSLTTAMADNYCPGRCQRDFPNSPARRAICRSFCRRSIACSFTSFIPSPVPPAISSCLGHSQQEYDACLALAQEIARRASAARS